MCHSVINDVGEQDQSEVEEEGKGSLKKGGPEEEERAHFLSVRRDRGTGIRDQPTVASSFAQMILIEASLSGLKGDEKPREAEVTGSHQLGVSTCGTASTMSKVDAELLGLQWETSNVAGGFGRSPLISPSLSSTRDDRNEPARHSLLPSRSFLPSVLGEI